MELPDMQTNHIFLIDSNSAGHRLSVDGHNFGTFATLEAAEAEDLLDAIYRQRARAACLLTSGGQREFRHLVLIHRNPGAADNGASTGVTLAQPVAAASSFSRRRA